MSARALAPASFLARGGDIVLLLLALGVVWHLLHLMAGDVALTAPIATFSYALDLLGQARFWPHVLETGKALLQAWLIAAFGGLALGTLLGINRLAGEVAEPLLIAFYSLPKVTLYPVILLIFGLGLPAKVAFGALHGILPVTIFTLGAMRAIKPVHLKTARVLRLSPMDAARSVWLPAVLPEIVTGQRIGFSLTLLGVLIGEMFASQRGLGFLIMNAIGLNDVKTIMAVVVILGVISVTINSVLLFIDKRLHRRVS